MIPKGEQCVLVARDPVDDLRRQLADDADRQAVGDYGRNVGDRNGEARLRPPRLQEIFHARPVSAHRRRDENSTGNAGLRRRKVRHLYDIVVGQFLRQSGIGGNLRRLFTSHELCLAWNGARHEPRQATKAMWPPQTQSARVAAGLDREAERTARRVSSASGTHNTSINAPRTKKLSLTPQ
jgi:hypothetical protein